LEFEYAYGISAVDLTGDGRLDIAAAAERGSNEVRWSRHEGLAGEAYPWSDEPVDIGHSKQLFVDDYLIDRVEDVTKKLNQPVKIAGKPLIEMVPEGDPHWEAGMPISFSSVIYDQEQQLFKLWYSLHENGQSDEAAVLAYATSRDGIHWEKPRLALHEYRGTSENNVVLTRDALECGVFKDQHETDPAHRYKMLYKGICAASSPDGLHWHDYNDGEKVIFHSPGHDSQCVAYWDDALGKYVAIIRDRTGWIKHVRPQLVADAEAKRLWQRLWPKTDRLRLPQDHTIRQVGQAESDDFVDWTPMRTIVAADESDPVNQDEFYNMQVMPYGPLRIGLMTVFSYDDEYCRGAVQLTYSRDGRTWHRAADRQLFLPLSDRPGAVDWGAIYPVQGPLVLGDEIWIYYVGSGVDHNQRLPPGATGFPNGIALAKLRLDGFVAVEADHAGTVTTKPFTFIGQELHINADAGRGRVAVELLDAKGQLIPGFGLDDADVLERDAVRHTVTWQGASDVSPLNGRLVRLRFHVERAKLFSFQFVANPRPGR
jgi:hypothetical protein